MHYDINKILGGILRGRERRSWCLEKIMENNYEMSGYIVEFMERI